VCFFAPYLWPAFSGGRIPFAGGAETQQRMLATGLAARGLEVVVATCDYGQGERVESQGITFLATHPPFAGLPGLRFLHPRLTGNLRALHRAAADVYYARGAGWSAAVAHHVARARRAAFVFGAAHDRDADPALPGVRGPRDRWAFRRALRDADLVVAQTAVQRERFARELGVAATVVPNPVELPARAADPAAGTALVWLSTYKPSKRPEWFVEIARRRPGMRCLMAGVVPPPPLTAEPFESARAAAAALPNLEVRGHVDHARIGELFAIAALFVHTSPAEGFPNTLLEAWAHGVPAVTAFDPDGILERERLGERVPDLDGLIAAVDRWWSEPARRAEAGARARAWVREHHAPDRVIDRFAALIGSLPTCPAPSGTRR
jgi:glycosyltransferase involved in cell wall biosynthesis